MNKFDKVLEQVSDGARFSVNFRSRVFKLNGKLVDLNGDWGISDSMKENIDILESLFDEYYHSVPSERSENRARNYFRALPEKELSDDDMCYGVIREVARCGLELHLLLLIHRGIFTWDLDVLGHECSWFWQSKIYPQFVILREWVEPTH